MAGTYHNPITTTAPPYNAAGAENIELQRQIDILRAQQQQQSRSFTHLQGNEALLATPFRRFPTIDPKFIRQTFHASFRPEDLPKLNDNVVARIYLMNGITGLLCCFEVYAQIVCSFAHQAVALPLQEAFATYRCHLLDLSVPYT